MTTPREGQPSSSEIGRRLDSLAHDMRSGFDGLNLRLDRYVLAEVHTLHMTNAHHRIDDLEAEIDDMRKDKTDGTRWVLSLAVGALSLLGTLIVGIVALVIK